jgi:hydrogenase nickel incorporation protein HypA/HybF
MHELSIAVRLVEAAEEAAAGAGATRVRRVSVAVGALSGVVPGALLFAYDVAASGTLLEGSELVIDEMPASVYCAACDLESVLVDVLDRHCPRCGAWKVELRGGRELDIMSLEVEVQEEAPCRHES